MAATPAALTAAEVRAVRRDTPGCGAGPLRRLRRLGRPAPVHFNAAGSSLPPRPVLEAQLRYLRDEARRGGYEQVEAEAAALRDVYAGVAELLNCAPAEVAVLESATAAWQQAFFGVRFAAGDEVWTSENEYGSNYINLLQARRRDGIAIRVVPNGPAGSLDVGRLEEMLAAAERPPKLLCVSMIPTSSGTVQPAAAIGAAAERYSVPYLLDACQAAGQVPLDVAELRCTWLTATGRKYLRGPRGSGFLYAREGAAAAAGEPAAGDVWGARWVGRDAYEFVGDAKRYEQYETSFAAKVGLGEAIRYALDVGVDRIAATVGPLAAELRERLRGLAGVAVHDRGAVLCGIVSFTKAGVDPEAAKARLAEAGISVTVSAVRSTRIAMEAQGLEAVLRASVHYYNTAGEVERFAAAVDRL